MKFEYGRDGVALKVTKLGVVLSQEGVSPVIHPLEEVLEVLQAELERRKAAKKPRRQLRAARCRLLNCYCMCASSAAHLAACLLVVF